MFKTQREAACLGIITEPMVQAAEREQVDPEVIRQGIAAGAIVMPFNRQRQAAQRQAVAFGRGLRTKVSASIGLPLSGGFSEEELAKLRVAIEAGTDAIMDLSIGVDERESTTLHDGPGLRSFLRRVLERSPLPVGTLPIYEVFAGRRGSTTGGALSMTVEEMFQVMEQQAAEGVDFFGLHSAMTLKTLEVAKRQGRLTHLVSWGGSLLAGWMLHHECENPLYTHFDRVLDICRRYDVTLSLADGLRPGSIHDSLDRAQVQEMIILGEQVRQAREAGVQIMVKGPGHAPLHHCKTTVQLQKQLCEDAPYFIFGPLATDSAPGYDHITCAIGAAVAAAAGADLICYVTPAEHVRFPTVEDVRQGVIAARIAAHAADIAKGCSAAWFRDDAVSMARANHDLTTQRTVVIDPSTFDATQPQDWNGMNSGDSAGESGCRICGEGCARRVLADYLNCPVEYC